MPCLWVGEPVCHACAVGNHDFQGVPVIMVSLFYPYPYTESVCVLRSLIPKKLHQCCTWLLLLQSEPYSLMRVMVRYLYPRTQKQCVPQNRSTWRPGFLFNFRGPRRAFKEAFNWFNLYKTNMLPAKTSRVFINYSEISSQSIIYIYMACLLKRSISAVSNLYFDVRILVRGRCVVIVSLSLLWIDIKQDAMRKPSIIKQETVYIEWSCSYCS